MSPSILRVPQPKGDGRVRDRRAGRALLVVVRRPMGSNGRGATSALVLLACALACSVPLVFMRLWSRRGTLPQLAPNPMKRAVILSAAVVVLVSITFLSMARQTSRSVADSTVQPSAAGAKADSVWYHTSDVALLSTTGRPQLVEFFHPN